MFSGKKWRPGSIRLSVSRLILLLGLALPFDAAAQTAWPQFRGFNGDGLYKGSRPLPDSLNPLTGYRWKCEVSLGVSSPCIWKDKIFLTGRQGDSLETFCISRKDGKILWRQYVVPQKFERVYPTSQPAAPTPVTDGTRLISYFGSYGLICYDFEGKLLWERKIQHEGNMYGTAVSPILYNNKLIFSRDADNNSYIEVMDPATGNTLWKTERKDFRANWSTPMCITLDGRDQLIVYGIWWLKAYDLANGQELWAFPGLTDEPIITPVYGNGLLYLTSYNMKTNPEVIGLPTWDSLLRMYDLNRDSLLVFNEIKENKSILSRYDDDGEGDHPLHGFFRWLDVDKDGFITKKEWGKIVAWVDSFPQENALIALRPSSVPGQDPEVVWRNNKGVPECPSPLWLSGLVYLVADGGLVTCLDAVTGEMKYYSKLGAGGAYYASPVAGDKKIFACSARGVITVFAEGPELRIISQNDFKERIMATPALADGKVYIRTFSSLYEF
jgi:outer membrane protein assembly factor BamB